jgi:2-C-methyl-D-erythritol 4-phosphate cytidylyltransferase
LKTGIIIVAGGSGVRMGAGVPKQFLRIGSREILALTLEKFRAALPDAEIVVVLPEEYTAVWNEIVRHDSLEGTHGVCTGGATRFESVRNGLNALGECDIIAVHDGVRPLVSVEMIRRCVDMAREHGTAIPVVEPVDSFRILPENASVKSPEPTQAEIIDRRRLRAVQTPQVFRAGLLREAYGAEYSAEFTDDASVVERHGACLAFCAGEYRNIKITTPDDMLFAEAVMRRETVVRGEATGSKR